MQTPAYAENAVIAGVMVNNDAFHDASTVVTAEQFTSPLRRRLWSALRDQILAGEPADVVTMMVTMFSQIGFVIVGVFTPVIGILIGSFVHFIIAKIVRSEATFKQLFSMNTYIFIISAISMIVNGIVFMMIGGDPEKLFTSLNSIIGAEGILGAVLNSIEVLRFLGRMGQENQR